MAHGQTRLTSNPSKAQWIGFGVTVLVLLGIGLISWLILRDDEKSPQGPPAAHSADQLSLLAAVNRNGWDGQIVILRPAPGKPLAVQADAYSGPSNCMVRVETSAGQGDPPHIYRVIGISHKTEGEPRVVLLNDPTVPQAFREALSKPNPTYQDVLAAFQQHGGKLGCM